MKDGIPVRSRPVHLQRRKHMDILIDLAIRNHFLDLTAMPSATPDPLNRQLGICKPYVKPGSYNEAIVLGGAGLTIWKRLAFLLEMIDLKVIKTDTIFIATGQRNTTEAETTKITAAGYTPGETEYELAIHAVSDLCLATFGDFTFLPTEFGLAKMQRVYLRDKNIQVSIMEGCIDPHRLDENGDKASHATREESLLPILQHFISSQGLHQILTISHSFWIKLDELRVQRTFMSTDATVGCIGPRNIDELITANGRLTVKHRDTLREVMQLYFEEALRDDPPTTI